MYVPHTAGRYQKKRFRKATCPIVERLTNALMKHGRNNGKKNLAIAIVKQTLEIIALVTNKNPMETVLRAISNAGPREDSTRIGSGGAVKKSAVDVSPLRRINNGIYLITTGARESSFRNIKNISECLADELIACATVNILYFYLPHFIIREVPLLMPLERRKKSRDLLNPIVKSVLNFSLYFEIINLIKNIETQIPTF